MLFWETLQCNRRFRSFIIDSDRGYEFTILVLFYAMEFKLDAAKQGVVRMCIFVLQTLTTEPNFGKRLNKKFEDQSSLPPSIRLADFDGSYGDFLIIVRATIDSFFTFVDLRQCIHILITTSQNKLDAIFPALLATINNVAAYLEDLSAQSSSRLLHLCTTMSAPSFLLANESNYTLLQSLLESMNAIIEHHYSSQCGSIYCDARADEKTRQSTFHSSSLQVKKTLRGITVIYFGEWKGGT